MGQRTESNWFPELDRIESASERSVVYREARRPVVWSWTYWAIAFGILIPAVFGSRMIATQLARWMPFIGGWIRLLVPGFGCGAGGVLTVWLVRERIRKNIRLGLKQRGIPICLGCSYDLTGNESGVCPECGTEIDADV